MAQGYIFIANGDSCPLCAALDGSLVPDGYRAHPGCTCNTVRMDDGERTCEFEYEEDGTYYNATLGGFRIVLDITVTCPDGSTHTVDKWGDTGLESLRAGDSDDFLEDIAHDACDELCDNGPEPNDFLCC
ncbi:MAG TPA: hypothetical protein PKV13_07710 [Propionicimonas sp.]|nr:hypothetical protein [Propionicimonas sp.]HRA06489.1 hypothetical protein [Propionicimonas sp.]